jgi:hypothetical protein
MKKLQVSIKFVKHQLIFAPQFLSSLFSIYKTAEWTQILNLDVVAFGRETNLTSDIQGRIPNGDVNE